MGKNHVKEVTDAVAAQSLVISALKAAAGRHSGELKELGVALENDATIRKDEQSKLLRYLLRVDEKLNTILSKTEQLGVEREVHKLPVTFAKPPVTPLPSPTPFTIAVAPKTTQDVVVAAPPVKARRKKTSDPTYPFECYQGISPETIAASIKFIIQVLLQKPTKHRMDPAEIGRVYSAYADLIQTVMRDAYVICFRNDKQCMFSIVGVFVALALVDKNRALRLLGDWRREQGPFHKLTEIWNEAGTSRGMGRGFQILDIWNNHVTGEPITRHPTSPDVPVIAGVVGDALEIFANQFITPALQGKNNAA